MTLGYVSGQTGKRILAVDNDPEVIHILEFNLAHADFEVISARNGMEALAKASTEKPDIILIDDELPDLETAEVCRQLKESQRTSHIMVIVIGAERQDKNGTAHAFGWADNYITKPFDPKEVVALVKTCSKRLERTRNIHPQTGLPNQVQVNKELTELIEQNKPFAAIYVDLDDLKAFNKVYGFAQGDRAIRLLSEILLEAVRSFGNPDDLVGHLGGDNFVVLTNLQKAKVLCRRIIADFESQIRTLYKREDLERGYIKYEGRLGQREECPIMSLRAAVVSSERRTFYHYLEVSESAAEQMDHLRRFPGSNCYFDLRENELQPGLSHRGLAHAHRELETLQGVLGWFTFLTRELEVPVMVIKGCLDLVDPAQAGSFTPQKQDIIKTIRENANHLSHIIDELNSLVRYQWITDGDSLEEVDLRSILCWVLEEVKELAEKRGIGIDIEGTERIGQLVIDARSLTQGLFYVLRSELKSSVSGDRIRIRASIKSKGFITIDIINRNQYIPRREVALLFQGQLQGMLASGQRNDLYLAKVVVQGIGGKLSVESKDGEGTTFTILIPRRWQSARDDVNALLSAAETSNKEAHSQLETIHRLLSLTGSDISPAIQESLKTLSYKVQELLVLCNRSLFEVDDLTHRLEAQQDQLLRQEVAQMATVEAILISSQGIARAMHARYLFDLDSAQRVAKCALAIANEFRLSRNEQQALHYAALLKDLWLALSPEDMVEHMIVPTLEKATALRTRFNPLWKALLQIDFLTPALTLILQRYKRSNTKNYPSSPGGASVPLGARILAVADAFDYMTQGLSHGGTMAPKRAMRKLSTDSRQSFDPEVVNVFKRVWMRKELYAV